MIQFKDMQIKYGEFLAIKNINLEVNKGEFFTFLGPSGCGKTTTLRALVGFLTPFSGSIIVNNNDLTKVAIEKRNIGIVFQSYALFPTMTVFENIAFGLKVKKLNKDIIKKKVIDVAKKIEISEDKLYNNVSELSGGQQQRVALARAIVLEPQILCLDEPLSNLDAKLRVGLRGELKRLQRQLGITTLYVTHDQEEALTLSDRIAVFNNGNIEQVGTPYEIYNNSKSEFVCDFIGDINRLKSDILEKINLNSSKKFDITKDGFIRIERIIAEKRENYIEIEGVIQESEYNGVMIKYTVCVLGQTIKYLNKNDSDNFYEKNQKINLYINPKDIMQF